MSIGTLLFILVVLFVIWQFISAAASLANAGAEIEMRKQLEDITHVVKEESYQDRLFWYDADNGQFLAWGDTQAELIDNLKVRFPSHIFYLHHSGEILCQPGWVPTPFLNKA
ncbi:MAG TPA: hypothetical protein VFM18_18315 [Methanosarcina sp.]|nr:hypothetical protein [Methanosarcina sp.]